MKVLDISMGLPRMLVSRAVRRVAGVRVLLAGWILAAAMTVPAAIAQNDVVRAPGDNPLSSISRTLKMQAPKANAPDWVVKTRKPEQETQFLPTGAAARTEPAPIMSYDRVKDIERSLDADRARHDRLSGRNAAPAAKKSVAMGPLPKKKTAKRDCVLTCASPIGSQKKR